MTDLELLVRASETVLAAIGELPTDSDKQMHIAVNGTLRAGIVAAINLGWSLEDIVVAVGLQHQCLEIEAAAMAATNKTKH